MQDCAGCTVELNRYQKLVKTLAFFVQVKIHCFGSTHASMSIEIHSITLRTMYLNILDTFPKLSI
jgi:hypothetical protein